MRLGKHEHVVSAWAERVNGPGWSNSLVWVLIRDGFDGKHRVAAIQPEEQTEEMMSVFDFSALSTRRLTAAVVATAKRSRK